MRGTHILLGYFEGRKAAALLVNGVLEDLLVDSDQPALGTIYRAMVQQSAKSLGGYFLRTSDGTAFLRSRKRIPANQLLLVQVNGYAEKAKAIPVSRRLLLKGRCAIVTPNDPGCNVSRRIRDDDRRSRFQELADHVMRGSKMGLIIRSAAEMCDIRDVSEEVHELRVRAEGLFDDSSNELSVLMEGVDSWGQALRDWEPTAMIVEEEGEGAQISGLVEEIEAAADPIVEISTHATMAIEATRALVAVDVNTGADMTPAAGLKANVAAAQALPRALRVKGLGGQVTVDCAPMDKKHRPVFENALRAAFQADQSDIVMAGWTPLGHYELQRQRDRVPLSDVFA